MQVPVRVGGAIAGMEFSQEIGPVGIHTERRELSRQVSLRGELGCTTDAVRAPFVVPARDIGFIS